VAIIISAIVLAVLVILTSSDQRLAFWFISGASLCFVIFRFASTTVVKLTQLIPKPTNPSLRLGLGNIHRRGSPAGSALFSLGLGLTALVTVMLVQANLDDKINETVPSEAPSFFFLDLQAKQVESFEETARNLPGLTKFERYQTLRGRITAIAGKPVIMTKVAKEVRWAVRGDRFLSYAREKAPDIKVVAGEWWPRDYAGAPWFPLRRISRKDLGSA
jgi:putative ABC transport system permease protein